jgi:hypothetical protein
VAAVKPEIKAVSIIYQFCEYLSNTSSFNKKLPKIKLFVIGNQSTGQTKQSCW